MRTALLVLVGSTLLLPACRKPPRTAEEGGIHPELPRQYLDTTYQLPPGRQWRPQTADELRTALRDSQPGDVIVLAAGVKYTGTFVLPVKSYPPSGTNSSSRWIYIVSSQMDELPPPGTRIDPTRDAAHMPKITTINAVSPITMKEGAKYWRLVGLEVYSETVQGGNPGANPPRNPFTYSLVNAEGRWSSNPLPDYLTVDRCYIHGSNEKDVREAVFGNANHLAVIDSYLSDIHDSNNDSQAVLAYASSGPIKIVNNYLSATGEDVMFGGAGGKDNKYQPADIEVRDNLFYKPLDWIPYTANPPRKWTVKNNFECKSCLRVLMEHNHIENNWKSGQEGFSIVLTVRTGQSGDTAVVNDITIRNNIIENVAAGVSNLAADNACGPGTGYDNCTNPGESKRVRISNNFFSFRNPSLPGGARNSLSVIAYGLSDWEFDHNSMELAPGVSTCWASFYFNVRQGAWPPPAGTSTTTNIWLLNNALCKQISGDNGAVGMTAVDRYMGQPPPAENRLTGNVFYVPPPDKPQEWPTGNTTTTAPPVYDPHTLKMTSPVWTQTTTGAQAGFQGLPCEQ